MVYTAKTRQVIVHETIEELEDWGRPDVLAAAISSTSELAFTATDFTQYKPYGVLEIDQELFLGPSVEATEATVTVTKRGHRGTTAATHAISSLVRFSPKYKQTRIIQLMNSCLESELQQYKIDDTSVLISADTYLYDLPSGTNNRNLKEVFIKTSDSTSRTGRKIKCYRINEGQGTGGLDQIEFKPGSGLIVGNYLSLRYTGGFTWLDDDSDSCDLPLNESAQSLPKLYICSKLLPTRENPRLRKDRNTFIEGSTKAGLRERGGNWYWDEFVRIRSQLGYAPKLNTPITAGWK